MEGIDALIGSDKIQIGSAAGSYFTAILKMEIEIKNVGYRKFEEVCIYQVANGKIVFEQFFRDI
jgi:hypothetical protein